MLLTHHWLYLVFAYLNPIWSRNKSIVNIKSQCLVTQIKKKSHILFSFVHPLHLPGLSNCVGQCASPQFPWARQAQVYLLSDEECYTLSVKNNDMECLFLGDQSDEVENGVCQDEFTSSKYSFSSNQKCL
jgi:hypothetical protein